MNIKMALKSRSYLLDLDCVKLSLGIFFLSCLMKSSFHQILGSTFIFCQKHTPKSCKFNVLPNYTCGNGSCWFLGVQYRVMVEFQEALTISVTNRCFIHPGVSLAVVLNC